MTLSEYYKNTKIEVEKYKASSREHQLSFADNAIKFADIFYRTLFLFSSGVFVLLPIYYEIVKPEGVLFSTIIDIIFFGNSFYMIELIR